MNSSKLSEFGQIYPEIVTGLLIIRMCLCTYAELELIFVYGRIFHFIEFYDICFCLCTLRVTWCTFTYKSEWYATLVHLIVFPINVFILVICPLWSETDINILINAIVYVFS